MKFPLMVLGTALLGACATNQQTNQYNVIIDKPVHCPMYYQPICATLQKDGQQFKKTFGNHCSAHAFTPDDTQVIDIIDGACDGEIPTPTKLIPHQYHD